MRTKQTSVEPVQNKITTIEGGNPVYAVCMLLMTRPVESSTNKHEVLVQTFTGPSSARGGSPPYRQCRKSKALVDALS
ncbi:hypothetical protein RRG08_055540 [Elysia crispata]|uniref:Uncharacterized protein n=1 Tax=Elysia crispata TaxID=231223 RepID=A0AAE1ADA2_9GAST|nr:hypothetical protein RRG08_055540 [Elysia crispata]